ncbi:MAG: P1 family peptidase [Desulfatibacillaceae bacterium]|nr:P1 family peptidase [Desulfatibacillaceae bacterium]
MKEIQLTDIDGILIGHAHNSEAATGCTVVLCPQGAAAGVSVRGGAPGTRETDLLKPENLVEKIHAVVLAGGSAFGLAAACGVADWLEKKGTGFDVGVTKVPIVCSAVLFDLLIGDFAVRPDAAMGAAACENAGKRGLALEGCVGAGAGATVGKLMGLDRAMKTGVGAFCVEEKGLMVGALVAVNCLGDVLDPDSGKKVAGLLAPDKKSLADTGQQMLELYLAGSDLFAGNTTLGVIITNAIFTKAQAKKVSSMAHNGFARAMRPAHTMYDGDTIFTLATGQVRADVSVVGMLAAEVMAKAVCRAATQACSWKDIPASSNLFGG